MLPINCEAKPSANKPIDLTVMFFHMYILDSCLIQYLALLRSIYDSRVLVVLWGISIV
jgi:hypothetical protein